MQQRPVRTSPPHVMPRGARAAIALCATLVALPLAAGSRARLSTRAGTHRPAVEVSSGTVASILAPALPHRGRSAADRLLGTPGSNPTAGVGSRVGELAAALGVASMNAAPGANAPAPVALTPRERLTLGAPGTYIGELLHARDSAVVRWPERVDRPLTVWVANAAGLPDWHPAYLSRVADAFAEWKRSGVPVHFRFVRDSGAAEVHVAWTDRFREPISGRTIWSRDDSWWITDANITLALHHNDGTPLDEDQVRAITLHEIGHLLGLDHTSDGSSIMAARVRVRELSSADQATARLIYALPPGHVQ